jgi:hypothetical protein
MIADYWWVNRVLVPRASCRRLGYGSIVLKRLMIEVSKSEVKLLRVSPGGYTNEKGRQYKFYLQNGFTQPDLHDELLEWRP